MRRNRPYSLLAGLVLLGAIPASRADVYYGDICWRASYATDISWQAGGSQTSQPTTLQATYQLGAYQKDGGHIALYGKLFAEDPATAAAVHGNAEAIGNSYAMTLTLAGTGGTEKFNDIVNVVLDVQTLNGTFESAGTHYNNSGPLGIHYGNGTMTMVTCP